MFAVIYRFKLKPHQETLYQQHWHKIATYFAQKRGAIGSCLHKGEGLPILAGQIKPHETLLGQERMRQVMCCLRIFVKRSKKYKHLKKRIRI